MPFFIPFAGFDAFTLITTIFWVWMLIDCFFHKPVKIGWVFFILFTQMIGAIFYYFAVCSHKNPIEAFKYYYAYITNHGLPVVRIQPQEQARQQPQQPLQPQQTPQYVPTPTYAYPGYEQGYQAQSQTQATQRGTASASPMAPQDIPSSQSHEEEMMLTYPEMPQQIM